MLRKVFPAGVGGTTPYDAFKVVLLSEGYTAALQKDFQNSCQALVSRFLQTPPFNLTRLKPTWINFYTGFFPSSQSGAASGTSTPGRTVFESAYTAGTKTLTINQSRVNAVIDDPGTTLPFDNGTVPLSEICVKGSMSQERFATLIVMLLPPITGEPATIDTESAFGDTDYHFIATTTNNHWQQAIFRAIGSKLGLGDEFELPGPEFQAATKQRDAPNINLQYLASAPATNRHPGLKWRHYFSLGEKILPPVMHPKAGDTSVPDNSISTVPLSPSSIEFWEGGGGFRTGVYRSAKDCLMRRRYGDSQLPVGAQPVPFCYVCRTYLKSLLE